jgi:hypothetical protein
MSRIASLTMLTTAAALVFGSASGALAASRSDHVRATHHARIIERSAPVYNSYEGFGYEGVSPYAAAPRDFYDHAKGDIADD